MNTFQMKVFACLFMFIDHIGAIFFPDLFFLRILGRLAFPIFSFLIANGFFYTKNMFHYIQRLFIFAFLSQIPFSLAFNTQGLNIFFTLFFGLLSIFLYEKSRKNKFAFLIPLFLGIIAEILNTDYGLYGVIVTFIFYFYHKEFHKMFYCIFFINLIFVSEEFIGFFTKKEFIFPIQLFSLISFVFIRIYNHKLGKKLKYTFYFFYPAHLLLFYFANKIFSL